MKKVQFLTITVAIGKPIKVDLPTKNVKRGRLAKISMEIDLAKLVVQEVWITNHFHKVEYERLHLLCLHCGYYGHVERNYCSQDQQIPVPVLGISRGATVGTKECWSGSRWA